MRASLEGEEARIWDLHKQSFPVSRIAALVGLSEAYVRSVITGAWLDDKAEAKGAKKKREVPRC